MRRTVASIAAVVLMSMAAMPGRAQSPDETVTLTRLAAERGSLLHAYDRAAWQATDDVRARFVQVLPRAGGYVVTGAATAPSVVFFDKARSLALYRAALSNGKLSSSGLTTGADQQLTALELRLIDARGKALEAFEKAEVGVCAKASPNLAVLPPAAGSDAVTVYLMTPRTSISSVPLGGHFSVEVEPDGSSGPVRSFTKSCYEMPLAPPKGGKPAALGISHLLDPTPTELHVFSSLSVGMPLYVITTSNRQIWAVEGNRVRLVDQNKVR